MNTHNQFSQATPQKGDPNQTPKNQINSSLPLTGDDKKLVYAKPKKNNLKKFLVGGAFVFVLFLGSIAGLKNLQQQTDNRSQADAATELEIQTSKEKYYVGQEGSFDIIIKPNGNQIIVTQMRLNFDPDIVEVTSINPGDFFNNPEVINLDNAIDNRNGTISFDIYKMPNLTPPPETTGVLAKIKFKALTEGESIVSFDRETLAGASNELTAPIEEGGSPINPIVSKRSGKIIISPKYLSCGSECDPAIEQGDFGSCGPTIKDDHFHIIIDSVCTKSNVNDKYYCADKGTVKTCREYAEDKESAEKYCCGGHVVPSINPSKPPQPTFQPQPTTKPELTPTPSPYIEVSLRNEQNSKVIREVCPVIYMDPVNQKFAVYDTTLCKKGSNLSIPLYTGASSGIRGAGIRIKLNDQDSIISAISNNEANSFKILKNNYYHYVWTRAWSTGARSIDITFGSNFPTNTPEPTKSPTNTPVPSITTIPIPTIGKDGPSITKGGGIWDRVIGVIGGLFR